MPDGQTNRRAFIAALGGAAAWPLAVRAQQPAMPVIGFLHPASIDVIADRVRAFRQGLKDTGFIEGENVAVEYRWAEDQTERLPALAAELVRRRQRRSPSSSRLAKTQSGSVLSRAWRVPGAT